MAKHFDKEFKTNAVRYYHEHRDLGLAGSAANLGICQQTLSIWQKELQDNGRQRWWLDSAFGIVLGNFGYGVSLQLQILNILHLFFF